MTKTGIDGTTIKECESILSSLFNRRYCILTGNGTSALCTIFGLISPERPKILLPSMMCLNPMLAVNYAGKIPVFADVLEKDATINPEIVEDMLEKDKEIGAVLAVHLFGNPADLKSLSRICNAHNVMLIEDLAQAFGGKCSKGRLLGEIGECSVLSFGYSKILDAGGGGAILTDDADLAKRARAMSAGFSDQSDKYQSLEVTYKKLFYTLWEYGQNDSRFYALFDVFPSLFKELHLYGTSDFYAKKIIDILQDIDEEVDMRRSIAEFYETSLKGISNITFFSPDTGYAPWRFSFRIDQKIRQRVLDNVRAAGFDISSWYPSIERWTASGRAQSGKDFGVSRVLEKEIVNLWVTRDYDKNKALLLVNEIKRNLL